MSKNKYIETVNMNQFMNLLDFSSESKVPFCIWGVKAVGKTEGVHQWCQKNNYRCIVLHLATQDVVDLIGMMKVVPNSNDQEIIYQLFNKSANNDHLSDEEMSFVSNYFENDVSSGYKTIWSRPEWLKEDGIPTCYFLDEFNRGNQFVLAAMLPFLIEGKIHTHNIGSKDFVVAACNPSTGNYNVNDSFEADEALKDRCGHAILEPSIEEFFEYAKDKLGKVTKRVLNKSKNFIEVKKFTMPFEVEPSRRSIINVMKYIDKKEKGWVNERASTILGTYLGSEFRDDWLSEYTHRLDALDLDTLMNFDENESLIRNSISITIKGKKEIKNDIFENAQDQIVKWLENRYRDGKDDISWLLKFFSIDVVQKDSVVSLMTKIESLNKPALLLKLFDSHILDNLEIISEYNQFTNKMEK